MAKKITRNWQLRAKKGSKGRPAKICNDGFATIEQAVKENNSVTLEDLSVIFLKKNNVHVGNAVLSRALSKLNLNRKKLSFRSIEKYSQESKKKNRVYFSSKTLFSRTICFYR